MTLQQNKMLAVNPGSCPAGEADVTWLLDCDHHTLPAQLSAFHIFLFQTSRPKDQNQHWKVPSQ